MKPFWFIAISKIFFYLNINQ